jgi:hypothetical protein
MGDVIELLFGTSDKAEVVKRKTTEKQVRAFSSGLEGLISLSVEECKKLCKACNNFEYLSGYENRIKQYTVTDETVDRCGDVVRAKGVLLDNYKNNPVVQFAHDYSLPPVGIAIKAWYDKQANAIKSWPLFFDDRIDSTGRADLIFRFVSSNAMRACSIGFDPIEWNDPDEDERKKIGLGKYGIEFTKCDMLEFSPVPVPANPSALQDDYKAAYFKGLSETLRSGKFTSNDVDVLRHYPIFHDSIIDQFIKEIGNPIVSIPQKIDSVNIVEKAPVINVNLDLKDIVIELAEVKKEVKELTDVVNRNLSEARTIARDAARSAAQQNGTKSLYDIMGINKNKGV